MQLSEKGAVQNQFLNMVLRPWAVFFVFERNAKAAGSTCGFCNKKRGEKNEKDKIHRLILLYRLNVNKKSAYLLKEF